jgi:hypothetical protein
LTEITRLVISSNTVAELSSVTIGSNSLTVGELNVIGGASLTIDEGFTLNFRCRGKAVLHTGGKTKNTVMISTIIMM